MNADALLPPPVPADCDLRGMPFLMIHIQRLTESDFYALSSGDAFKAAVTLWCQAFYQVPAGSPPDNDIVLAYLSAAGAKWPELRGMALYGLRRFADGRLYHAVLTERVLAAWTERQASRARTAAATKARQMRRAAVASDTGDVTMTVTSNVTLPKLKWKGEVEDCSELRSDDASAAPPPAQAELPAIPQAPFDAREALWREGIPMLRRLSGKSEAQARTLLGKLLRDAGDDCARVLAAIREAHDLRPADPMAWLNRAVQPTRPFRNGFLEMGRLEAQGDLPGDLVEGTAEEVEG